MTGPSEAHHSKQTLAKRRIRAREIDRAFRIANHSPSRILDVGFGNGAIISAFSDRGIDSVGIEVNEGFVKKAREQFPNTEFRHYDGIQFPFEDASFDTVLLNDVLEHISYHNIEQVMKEVHRVLKPAGLVYISVMNRWQLIEPHTLIPLLTWLPRVAWHPVCKRVRNKDYINYWPYTRKRLDSLLERRNFKFTDLTKIYVQHKFLGINPIGDRLTSRMVRFLRKMRLDMITYSLALKVSVLVYVGFKK